MLLQQVQYAAWANCWHAQESTPKFPEAKLWRGLSRLILIFMSVLKVIFFSKSNCDCLMKTSRQF